MALIKQPIRVNFSQGLDLKTDPFQVPIGNFLSLQNMVFNTLGQLTKRNGFGYLSVLPEASTFFLTTYKSNLTALSSSQLQAYSEDTNQWIPKGNISPVSLSVLPLIHSNFSQVQMDTAIAPNGLIGIAWTETGSGATLVKYAIADSVTGQMIVNPTLIPAIGGGTITGSPRVFLLDNYFIIAFTNDISGVYQLQYIAISTINPNVVTSPQDISSNYIPKTTLSWDGVVVNNQLFFAYNTASGSQRINVTYITNTLGAPVTPKSFIGQIATIMSLTADTTGNTPVIYVSYWDAAGSTGYSLAVNQILAVVMSPVQWLATGTILNVTSSAQFGTLSIYYENANEVSVLQSTYQNFLSKVTITQGPVFYSVFSSGASSITASSGTGLVTGMTIVDNTTPANIATATTITVSGTTLTLANDTVGNSASSPGDLLLAVTIASTAVIVRNTGLASKSFIYQGNIYFVGVQSSQLQPVYFLMNSLGYVVSYFAYQNAGGYYTLGLPNPQVIEDNVYVAYLYKDLINSINKGTNNPSGTQTGAIYTQTGINLATFNFDPQPNAVEIGSNLILTGGFVSSYDGTALTEQGFFLYPENLSATVANSGGSIGIDTYFYQAVYEWTDNQANVFHSAPSVPLEVVVADADSVVTIYVPTLRQTLKNTPVKISLYRWSTIQEEYYQVTSITAPVINSVATDYVTIVDSADNATILGNNLIYTTGGIVEDVAPPPCNILTLFDTRVWMVDAEDTNLLWFSKQVIEATPVEMSDLFTMYIAPNTGAQGSTGPITALQPMDDKLIIFKANALYYVNGAGPDNLGNNSQYSNPIFITSSVGTIYPRSLILIPNGIMFQSNKGLWILGRDLSTNYIGAPVESLTLNAVVTSAVNVPATNQVRFTLDSGVTLMYDYYVNQWGTFTISSVSSVIYNGLHTYVNTLGLVFQETPDIYLDGSSPVLMALTTSWLQVAGIQGFERFYFFFLLGRYITPFTLNVNLSFDFNNGPSQSISVTPNNYSPSWGGDADWGTGTVWGGPGNAFKARIFPNQPKCESFQISINEVYDSSYGIQAGAGLTLSGLNIISGAKRAFRTQSAVRSFG